MPYYPYLIIGGGMTAASAVHGIRQVDPQGKIGLISAEDHSPYDRPPLTKGLWKGKPLEKILSTDGRAQPGNAPGPARRCARPGCQTGGG